MDWLIIGAGIVAVVIVVWRAVSDEMQATLRDIDAERLVLAFVH